MKFLIMLTLTVLLCSGCGSWTNKLKHLHSSFTGLERKITLYDANGKVIKEWSTQAQIEDRGGSVFFVVNGKAVSIAGTYIIEEK